ncbi:alpha/beta hydrolase-fold protein [Lysinibacillus sp. CNPSo 3705]|uniref:alpha/beta hydrolase n=1 Tax=Lysinibacillus sp. CNPSo 3705 TaxID=3028148 RepID=UPI00236353F8|nr:alpha/beta hydrolase-fold protein [Lysinibacillus sp. CNPSo 3705]MDD1501591.1 alpha/beta hydrolase-fold protein [Lysinibacillus sp. CNPSo 3705]
MMEEKIEKVLDYETQQIVSKFTDYTYTINIYVPNGEVPQGGFPVLYVLDGSSYFHLVKEAVRLQSRNAPKTGVLPTIVVGIGHGTDMHERRFYDFTGQAETYTYPARFKGNGYEKHGGAANFSRFLEEELKPSIQAEFPVNMQHEALFGHSLAGYYVLWQLFHHQASFQRYIAISPSIWWNEHELFNFASTFIKERPFAYEKLFIGVGELETFMVDDAQQIASELQKIMDISFYEALEENHASIVPTVMSRAIRFMNKK